MEARLKRVASVVGWDTRCYFAFNDPQNGAAIGYVCLDYNSAYGGYNVEQTMTMTGGVKILNAPGRMSARELMAWFDGVEYGYGKPRNTPS